MKKRISLLIALLMLLSLSACGEEQGITIINNLGVDLIVVDLINEEGTGTSLPAGIPNGDSNIAYMRYAKKEGNVEITGTDTDRNLYYFPEIYLHDGVELHLDWENGSLYARYVYEDTLWEYDGQFISVTNLNAQVAGTWIHSSEDHKLVLDGVDGFTWKNEFGVTTGEYTFDGQTVTLLFDGMFMEMYQNDEGNLCRDGEAGDYYTRQD